MREWQRIDETEPVRASGFRGQASWNALLMRNGVMKLRSAALQAAPSVRGSAEAESDMQSRVRGA